VRELEKRFAGIIGVKEAVAVSSGTDADALALAVLYDFGAKRGDEVIIPSLTFIGTANAVLQAGFKPVFVDIERETLNIDPDKIETVITARTIAVMPVHLMGKPAKMERINKIARKHKLFVIEDAAEALGAEYKGKPVGTFGDMACYSLYVAHIITSIEGGIVITERKDFAEILRSLRTHGRACKCEKCILNIREGYCAKRFKYGEDIRFVFERPGFSSKMNELEAAIGLGNLDIYNEILEKRRKNLKLLREGIRKFKAYLSTIDEDPYEKIGPMGFPVILREGAPFTRNKMVDFLEKKGIDTRNLFSSIPTQTPAYSFMGEKEGKYPEAEYIGRNGFHIGVHQDLTKRHIEYFIDTVEEFIKSL
jgi:dTDP-4-amino-4,6-dideoxygalactose transaminase